MKWILFVLCLLGMYKTMAQEFLGEPEREIRQFIVGKGSKMMIAGDTVRCNCWEEDERGRVFEVAYTFIMSDNVCRAYQKTVALHEYWVNFIYELVESRESEGVGDVFKIEGKRLFPEYQFEDFVLKVKLKEGELSMEFAIRKVS